MALRGGKAIFDYDGQEDDELSLQRGDRFLLIRAYDDGWWHVDVNGEEGMIPSNYVQLDPEDDAEAERSPHSPGSKVELLTGSSSSQHFGRDQSIRSNKSSRTALAPDEGPIASSSRANRNSRNELSSEVHPQSLASPEKVIVKKKSKTVLQSPPPMVFAEDESPREPVLEAPMELERTPRDGSLSGAASGASTLSGHSPELKRLKEMREQATAKIDVLRYVHNRLFHAKGIERKRTT